ncbi:hypothetical protein B296_00004025 [Ensete ventricosum]|uniref:Uncharacterized protein n=1 Tax=Ensete ventricosum TaxID=4639 RepID=A0A426Z7N5_ENSVE|nr:hypothetical protein B296_00004025 [Ensete ventricosum]
MAAGEGHSVVKQMAAATGRSQRRSIPLEQRSGMRSRVPQIAQGSNRPPLPVRHSVRNEAIVPSVIRKCKHKRKQSMSARRTRMQGKVVTLPWEKHPREKPTLIGNLSPSPDGRKLCAKSCVKLSFNRFFVHHLGISKY